MKEIEIQALQEICGLHGHQKSYGKCFHQIVGRLDYILTLPYQEMLVLGWLNSKDVLIAQWGDGENPRDDKTLVCRHCHESSLLANPSGYCSHIEYPHGCDVCHKKFVGWQYHSNQQAGFTASERIAYWKENKK